MKNLNIYILFLLVTIPVLSLNAQDRNVVWVHGLGGDQSSWAHYEDIFSRERKINSHRKTYNTSSTIDYTANEVISSVDNILGNGATNSRNIAIGHSMGGVVIRDVDRLTGSNKRFGGLITVTAPNYGAPIANSILDGSLEDEAINACNKISAGPIVQSLSLPWNVVGNITNQILCNYFVDNDLVQNLQGNPTINDDLKVGSATINAINAYNTTTPRICIYAQENSPVHWRMFSSETSDNDTEIVSYVNTARNIYKAYYDYNIGKGIANSWNPWLSAMYFNRAAQWKKGVNWIDDSESIWNALIKTTRIETYTYTYRVYTCVSDWPVQVKIIPDECVWVYVTETRRVAVNYPSDGLLPVYSQKLQGLPGGNYYHVNGANHLEVRNMSNSSQGDITKIRFDQIWDDRQPGDFFRTPKR